MRSRRSRFAAALLALGGMLFLQAALAFACEYPQRSAALAVQAAQHAAAGCHESTDSPNLCLAHCQSEDQTLGKPQVSLPDVWVAPAAIPAFPAAPLSTPIPRGSSGPAAAGPPPRILFQTFRL